MNGPVNHLLKLLELYPDADWNYYWLSSNPNITWDFVQSKPNADWDYCLLSANPNITIDIIQANPDKPWNGYGISQNPSMDLEIIKNFSNHYTMASNSKVTMDIIE